MFKNPFKLQHFIYMVVILTFDLDCYELNMNVDQRFYTNSSNLNLLRFRNFEPRYAIETDIERMTTTTTTLFDGLVSKTRKARGFQFHADDRDISIEMEFIVPFVRIPIERSMSVAKTAFRNLFNLNFQSLLTTGAIVAVGGLLAVILKGLFTPFVHSQQYKKNSRLEETNGVSTILDSFSYKTYAGNATNSILNINQLASILETKLHDNNINVRHCIQKSICNYAQKSIWDVKTGTGAGSFQKILDGIISLDLVHNYLSGTALQRTLYSAKDGDNCDHMYRDCNWSFPTKKILTFLT